ncbi:MAG: hypothetical protein Q9204_001286 [Flavoplaca sp. TL-2023a]
MDASSSGEHNPGENTDQPPWVNFKTWYPAQLDGHSHGPSVDPTMGSASTQPSSPDGRLALDSTSVAPKGSTQPTVKLPPNQSDQIKPITSQPSTSTTESSLKNSEQNASTLKQPSTSTTESSLKNSEQNASTLNQPSTSTTEPSLKNSEQKEYDTSVPPLADAPPNQQEQPRDDTSVPPVVGTPPPNQQGQPAGDESNNGTFRFECERETHDHASSVSPEQVNVPQDHAINDYSDTQIDPRIKRNLSQANITHLTPAQHAVLAATIAQPAARRAFQDIEMRFEDIIATFPPGVGKTLAYLIPALTWLSSEGEGTAEATGPDDARARPRILIISHTREVAIQIFKWAVSLCRQIHRRCRVVYGGERTKSIQIRKLSRGCDILVATPGRLRTFLGEADRLTLDRLKLAIFDEAHVLMQDVWHEVLTFIRESAPQHRTWNMWFFASSLPEQTLDEISNTWFPVVPPQSQEPEADDSPYMQSQDPVAIRPTDQTWYKQLASNTSLMEVVAPRSGERRLELAKNLIMEQPSEKFLILVQETADVGPVVDYIGSSVTGLHGLTVQQKREQSVTNFRTGSRRILVATLRHFGYGVDFPTVSRLILLALPPSVHDYRSAIKRVGRLGRAATVTVYWDPTDSHECSLMQDVHDNVDSEFSGVEEHQV